METKTLNFEVISQQYRKKGAALRGFRTLNPLIKNDATQSLQKLLRNHYVEPIDSILEVKQRDDIDFLIDYYSILEIGLIANYFPNPLPPNVENEIKHILNDDFVKRYYTKHYPISLPQLILRQVIENEGQRYFDHHTTHNSATLFERFLILNHYVKNDKDIDQFLWFLDDGWDHGYAISDLWNVLDNDQILIHKLRSTKNHPLNSALWGFIKYTQFLTDFADLIKDSEEDKLLQSAFWHHQSYWLDHMNGKIGDIISIGITNIQKSMSHLGSENLIHNKHSFINSQDDLINFQKKGDELNDVINDIEYLLNNNLGNTLYSLSMEGQF